VSSSSYTKYTEPVANVSGTDVPQLQVVEIVTFAEPLNDTEPFTAPDSAIVLAVASLVAVPAFPDTDV
jgi:hypothetical protein